ncbi:MAG: flavin reductase family protein [Acidimicrobiales bacterium]|nr:flavin reductase family protein [Acidimicrobiales bacterium]
MGETIDGDRYRKVLGRYPTGVTLVTATDEDGPVGMIIGSFVSVSLEPPLVGFLPAKGSQTWPLIEATGVFCVNVLADDQKGLVDLFVGKEGDPWASVPFRLADSGSPIVEGAVAAIDCSIDRVVEAGDHWFVTGEVTGVEYSDEGSPLVFLGGVYGLFEGLS